MKKFTSRTAAVERIWKAVQTLSAKVPPQVAHVAPSKGKRDRVGRKAKRRHTARTVANDSPSVAREGSKKATVIDLMRRSQGATLAEIMDLTGWQAHTVRGFVSGMLVKKLGLKIDSFRSEEKERTYRIQRMRSLLPTRAPGIAPGGVAHYARRPVDVGLTPLGPLAVMPAD